MKRSYRITLSSILAAGIALGGFYSGYAKNGLDAPRAPKEIEPTYVDMLPPNTNYALVVKRPSEFGITPAEVEKVRANCKKFLADYLAAQRTDYEGRLRRATLAQEGKAIGINGRVGIMGVADLRAFEKDQRPLMTAWAILSSEVARTIGPAKNAKVVAELNEYRDWEKDYERFDVLFETQTMNALDLSQIQRNQYIMLTACIANAVNYGKKAESMPIEFDQVAPKIDEYRKAVQNSDRAHKGFYFNSAVDLLSPIQRFRFETIMRNRQYVKP